MQSCHLATLLACQLPPCYLVILLTSFYLASMIRCASHKKVYLTQELAEEALVAARITYSYAAGGGPVAVYRCEDCGYFHLTSSGAMNERLSKEISDGNIERQKEANRWEDKIRKKRR